MDSKNKSRSVTRKGINGKSKTTDEAVRDDKVKELPLKDEIGWTARHFDKCKGGEKSALKKSEAGGRIETTTNDKKNVTEEREIKNFETPMKRKRGADGEIVQAFLLSVDKGSSRLRPRKVVPEFKMVELADEDCERIIGKRVKVYWSGSRKWFPGRVKAFDNKVMLHTIYYEDGDKEDLNLSRERFQLEVMPGENFNLKLEPKSEKTIKVSDDGMVIAEFLKNISGKKGNSELKENSEPMKKDEPKNAFGGSKPKRKDAEVRKAEDLVTEMDVEGGEKHHLESKSLLDKATDANKSSEAQVSRLESDSETRDMGSYGGEEGEKSVKGTFVNQGDAQPQKKHIKLNKKAAPTTRAAKLKHSKAQLEESNEEEKLSANVEFDGNEGEVEPDRMNLQTNLEESLDLSFLKEEDRAKSPKRESSPGNGKMSQEAEVSRSNLNAEENELGLDGRKLSRVTGDGRSTLPHSSQDIMEDLDTGVEVDVHPIKVDETVEGGELKVEGICKESLNLQPIEPESLEGHEILQDITMEALEESVSEGMKRTSSHGPKQSADSQNENHTTLSAIVIQKNIVRRARTKVQKL